MNTFPFGFHNHPEKEYNTFMDSKENAMNKKKSNQTRGDEDAIIISQMERMANTLFCARNEVV
jgi:hypothetical protein